MRGHEMLQWSFATGKFHSFIHLISIYSGYIRGVFLYRTVLTNYHSLEDLTEICCLTVLEANSPRLARLALLRAMWENLFSMPPHQLPVICLPSVVFLGVQNPMPSLRLHPHMTFF